MTFASNKVTRITSTTVGEVETIGENTEGTVAVSGFTATVTGTSTGVNLTLTVAEDKASFEKSINSTKRKFVKFTGDIHPLPLMGTWVADVTGTEFVTGDTTTGKLFLTFAAGTWTMNRVMSNATTELFYAEYTESTDFAYNDLTVSTSIGSDLIFTDATKTSFKTTMILEGLTNGAKTFIKFTDAIPRSDLIGTWKSSNLYFEGNKKLTGYREITFTTNTMAITRTILETNDSNHPTGTTDEQEYPLFQFFDRDTTTGYIEAVYDPIEGDDTLTYAGPYKFVTASNKQKFTRGTVSIIYTKQ